MSKRLSTSWMPVRITAVVILALLGFFPASAHLVASTSPQAPTGPLSWPPDPTSEIAWSGGTSTVANIQSAFNNAHTQENAQLGLSLPMFTLPSQSEWNAMSDGDKALWLINHERQARGVTPLHAVEFNVTSVAQNYANYLLANNAFSHTADGHNPIWRLNANPTINACHDFFPLPKTWLYFGPAAAASRCQSSVRFTFGCMKTAEGVIGAIAMPSCIIPILRMAVYLPWRVSWALAGRTVPIRAGTTLKSSS